MVQKTLPKTTRKESGQRAIFNRLNNDIKEIKLQLRKLVLFVPEDSLKEYSNSADIKKAYRDATRAYPPK